MPLSRAIILSYASLDAFPRRRATARRACPLADSAWKSGRTCQRLPDDQRDRQRYLELCPFVSRDHHHKDEDFAQRRTMSTTGPTIVWVRIGNARTGPLLEWFALGFEPLCRAIERGETLIELV